MKSFLFHLRWQSMDEMKLNTCATRTYFGKKQELPLEKRYRSVRIRSIPKKIYYKIFDLSRKSLITWLESNVLWSNSDISPSSTSINVCAKIFTRINWKTYLNVAHPIWFYQNFTHECNEIQSKSTHSQTSTHAHLNGNLPLRKILNVEPVLLMHFRKSL